MVGGETDGRLVYKVSQHQSALEVSALVATPATACSEKKKKMSVRAETRTILPKRGK